VNVDLSLTISWIINTEHFKNKMCCSWRTWNNNCSIFLLSLWMIHYIHSANYSSKFEHITMENIHYAICS